MKSGKFAVLIQWSDEDESFIAEVPELAGCMADGATYQEALANVEIVIQEWIETAQQLERPIPEPIRYARVNEVHTLRERLQKKYGTMPDSTPLLQADRDR